MTTGSACSRPLERSQAERPIDYPDDPGVVTAPTDCIIDMIVDNLAPDTSLPIKAAVTMSVGRLLDGFKYAERFIGGTAASCVLMPDTCHRCRGPCKVTGTSTFRVGEVPWLARARLPCLRRTAMTVSAPSTISTRARCGPPAHEPEGSDSRRASSVFVCSSGANPTTPGCTRSQGRVRAPTVMVPAGHRGAGIYGCPSRTLRGSGRRSDLARSPRTGASKGRRAGLRDRPAGGGAEHAGGTASPDSPTTPLPGSSQPADRAVAQIPCSRRAEGRRYTAQVTTEHTAYAARNAR
ncbi:phosphatidylserine decarboxylase [Streptomyces sp. BE303]|uniref:phosphatidylserine decarboxylase n=1 Tax=Streptomyces sp. BE303 TaxID=3002528 RepID=UPI003FA6EE8E